MNQPPKSSVEYWVRFFFASLAFGLLGGCGVFALLDHFALKTFIIGWGIFTVSAAMIAARYGDSAWSSLIKWLTCLFYEFKL